MALEAIPLTPATLPIKNIINDERRAARGPSPVRRRRFGRVHGWWKLSDVDHKLSVLEKRYGAAAGFPGVVLCVVDRG